MTSEQPDGWHPSRRELLTSLLVGSSSLFLSGCSDRRLPAAGELRSPSLDVGHRIRDGAKFKPAESDWEEIGVVIVGGGIAALSAGWRLQQTGFEDFKLLELEREPGGTSRSGSSSVSSYPWGAHYVPLPQPSNKALRRLFAEMSVFEPGAEGSSNPVVAEHVLCREPQERLFAKGQWFAGLFPHSIASDDDLRQW